MTKRIIPWLSQPRIRTAILAALVLLAVIPFVLVLIRTDLRELTISIGNDYRVYWSATRLLITGGNPYDQSQLFDLERASGSAGNDLLIFWNPPWALALLIPFAIIPFTLSSMIWLGCSFIITLLCGVLLWRELAPPGDKRYALGMLIATVYMPTLQTLKIGQISPLLLLSIALLIIALRRKQEILAGLMLAMLLNKPHLTFLLLLSIACWIVVEGRWKVVLGAVIGLGAACAIAALFSPAIFSQYLHAESGLPFMLRTATLGTWLRTVFGVNLHWLQYLPSVIGILVNIVWLARRKIGWIWIQLLPPLLLGSAITAAYGWNYDTMILLPVVVILISSLHYLPVRVSIAIIILYILAQVALVVSNLLSLDGATLYWYPLVLAVLYVWQERMLRLETNHSAREVSWRN